MAKSRFSTIIDTSVFAKWFLPDEYEREKAFRIREDYTNEQLAISLPSITFYEVNNMFRSAVLRKRIGSKEAIKAFDEFLQLDFTVYPMEDFQERILKQAIFLSLSSYDASYIVLAEYLQISFYTADKILVKKSGSRFVLHLSSYESK